VSVFVDLSPLREFPAFKRYFFGQLVSVFGSMLTVVALQYQAYKLGGDSTKTVALLATATIIPFVFTSMIGGAIADSYDKRKVLLLTQGLLGICSLLLAFNARSSSPKLWVLFAVGIALNALVGIDWPTRSATAMTLVDKSATQRALALTIGMFNTAGIAGPVLAAFFVRRYLGWLYAVDALTYLVSFVSVLSLPPRPPVGDRRAVSFATVADGFRYLKTQRTIQSTFAADLGAMIFGLPDALFPAFAEQVFHDTRSLGYLKAAPAVGAVMAGALSGWTHKIRRQGWAVIVCIVIWGLGIAVFGATHLLPVALVGLTRSRPCFARPLCRSTSPTSTAGGFRRSSWRLCEADRSSAKPSRALPLASVACSSPRCPVASCVWSGSLQLRPFIPNCGIGKHRNRP
jgi:MFS family permease